MKKKGYVYQCFAVVICLSLLVIGCARPPTQEVTKAEQAIAEARTVEADLYVENEFQKAEDALKRAKDLIAEKKYKEAKTAAEEAANSAQQAISMVEQNKLKMKEEAEQMVQDVQKSIDEVKSLVVTAVKKKVPINREEIQGIIGKAEIDMVSIKDQLQEQKIRLAFDQLKSLAEQMKSQKESFTTLLEQKLAEKK